MLLLFSFCASSDHCHGFPNPLSANPTKWSNILKQFVIKLNFERGSKSYVIDKIILSQFWVKFFVRFGVIHLVHTQKVPTNGHFLPPDMCTYVCISRGKK